MGGFCISGGKKFWIRRIQTALELNEQFEKKDPVIPN